jgi:hypothetical protein
MAAYDYYWEKPCLLKKSEKSWHNCGHICSVFIIDKDEESILFNKYAKI